MSRAQICEIMHAPGLGVESDHVSEIMRVPGSRTLDNKALHQPGLTKYTQL